MPTPPRRIAARYELLHPISSGGMGQVWQGYDVVLDRPVAVKVIRPDIVADPTQYGEFAARFKREARITARIDHPGIPAVYDAAIDSEQGELFLVMQLVRGVPLTDLIAEEAPLPIATAVAVIAQVCAALSHAHAIPVVHRDLKPSNVMVANDGTVKVLDFGIAAALRTDMTRITVTGTQLGSYDYMPPEQVLGGGVSPRSDLYSVGCLLYELLTGRRVFAEKHTVFTLQRAHVERVPEPPSTHRPDLPTDLDELVMALLAKEAERRPETAEAVFRRLAPHLPAGQPSEPETPTPPGALPDPTLPYRRPLAPRPRTATGDAVASTPTDPAVAPPGVSAADLAEAYEHAQSLIEDDRFAQATAVLDEALDRATPALGAEERRVVKLRLLRATALVLSEDARRALPEFQRLAEVFARVEGPESERALDCRYQAVLCMAQLGETTAAIATAEDLLRPMRAVMGDRSDPVLELRLYLGKFLLRAGHVERAGEHLAALYPDLRAEYGPDAPEVREVADLLTRLRRRQDPE